jgi:hypothetical protein
MSLARERVLTSRLKLGKPAEKVPRLFLPPVGELTRTAVREFAPANPLVPSMAAWQP